MKNKILALLTTVVIGYSSIASAIPVMTYTASGSEGNYILDFTLENTIDPSYNQSLYFFGVNLLDSGQGSPDGWNDWGGTWDNTYYGGSSINYQSTWITGYGGSYAIQSGDSLSGFTVSSLVLPDLVNFYTFGTGNDYYESDAFYQGSNPGFEGSNGGTAPVSEPVTLTLLGLGLAGIGFSRRKKTA